MVLTKGVSAQLVLDMTGPDVTLSPDNLSGVEPWQCGISLV